MKQTAWAIAFGFGMVFSISAYAQQDILPQTQRQVVTTLEQVQDFKEVKKYKEMYPALSAANLVYSQCSKEFDLTEAEETYLKNKFDTVSKNYIRAYQDAYVATSHSPPPQSFVDAVVKRLTGIQQEAVDSVALVLRQKKGCNDGRLRPIVKYVERLRRQDKVIANQKPVEPAQPYQ